MVKVVSVDGKVIGVYTDAFALTLDLMSIMGADSAPEEIEHGALFWIIYWLLYIQMSNISNQPESE